MEEATIHIPRKSGELIPGFDAVIPSYIRYDSRLSNDAKLLYGEIRALTNAYGFCWASDDYFARLYNVSTKTIRRWIQNLEEVGHISVTKERNDEDLKLYRIIRLLEGAQEPPKEKTDKNVQNFGQNCPKKRTKMSQGIYIDNINNIDKRACARITQNNSKGKANFKNYQQRDYNFDELERALLNKTSVGDTG